MGQSSTRRFTFLALPVFAGIVFRNIFASHRLSLHDVKAPEFSLLTKDQLAEYKSTGFVVVRGLVPPEELVEAGQDYFNSFSLLDFIFGSMYAKLGMQLWRQDQRFAEAALFGALPAISAQLLGTDDPKSSIRLLKDGFFGFRSKDNTGCGFHQDDAGFWPAAEPSSGVNFWVALSPVKAEEGGGIRVVNQSALDPDAAAHCIAVIRPNTTTAYNATCRMHEISPWCHEQMMEASVVHDLAPGDALVWERHTFHRSEPFHVAVDEPKLRYTVRYVAEDAIAQGMLHPFVETGKPFDTPYHPRVWPSLLPHERKAIEQGLESDMPILRNLVRYTKGLAPKIFVNRLYLTEIFIW